MNWLQFAVQWLHVLLGITWFGYSIAMYFLIVPPLMSQPESQLRDTYHRLGERGARVFPIVGSLVLILGIIRGTLFGPIQSLDLIFTTAYGITWLVALLATLALFANGARNIGPSFAALRDSPDFAAGFERVRNYVRVDLALFGLVFTCMILMRFGY